MYPIDLLIGVRSDDQNYLHNTECTLSSDPQLWTPIWTSRWIWNNLILKTLKLCYANNTQTKNHRLQTSFDHLNWSLKIQTWSQFILIQYSWLLKDKLTLTNLNFYDWVLSNDECLSYASDLVLLLTLYVIKLS